MKQLRAMVLIFFALLILILVVQNFEAMSTSVRFRLNLLFFQHETAQISLYLLSVVCFLLGVVIMGFYGIRERFRLKKRIKDLTREAAEKERELNALRNLPVTGEALNPVPRPGKN